MIKTWRKSELFRVCFVFNKKYVLLSNFRETSRNSWLKKKYDRHRIDQLSITWQYRLFAYGTDALRDTSLVTWSWHRLSSISISSRLLSVDINYSSYTLQPLPSRTQLFVLWYFLRSTISGGGAEESKKRWDCTEKSSILSACHSASKASTVLFQVVCFSIRSSSSIHQVHQFIKFFNSHLSSLKLLRSSFKLLFIPRLLLSVQTRKPNPITPPPPKKKIILN